jgi:serine/threonine protein kinase/WD40 repeat protein
MADSSSADRDPVERLAEEFLQRRRQGESPALTEYVRRHPELADEIRAVFPALLLMEQADPGSSELARAGRPEDDSPSDAFPQQLGDFRILRQVGRGGMGVVYEAEQVSLGRRVALKVLPPEAQVNPRYLARFEREARAAARLHHTNIVPVYGVGTDRGVHYYAMQFIQGQALDEVLAELRRLRDGKAAPAELVSVSVHEVARSLLTGPELREAAAGPATVDHVSSAPSRSAAGSTAAGSGTLPGQEPNSPTYAQRAYWRSVARVGVQAAGALAYAHAEGILHRDIKPSNLLLDGRGHVWVADFGLAKSAESDDLTGTGDIVGTVRYMAPERFQGQTDVRSDVYALGVTLYEMAALTPAFPESDRHKLIRQVSSEEPAHLRRLAPAMPRDLRTIIHKAIDRDPARRYATAAALAEDLQRFLDDRPIQARPPGPVELFGRWCRRNPAVVSLLGAVVVVTLLGFAGVVLQWQEAVDNSIRAETNEDIANKRGDALEKVNGDLVKSEKIAVGRQLVIQRVNDDLLVTQDRLRHALYIADMRLVPNAFERENLGPVQNLLERQIPGAGEKDQRGFEWYYWDRQRHPDAEVQLQGDQPGSKAPFIARTDVPAFSLDGTLVAAVANVGRQMGFKVWDTRTGEVQCLCLGAILVGQEGPFVGPAIALSADGTRLAAYVAISGGRGGQGRSELWFWDTTTGHELWHCEATFNPHASLAFHPDGSRLAAVAASPAQPKKVEVTVWDTFTGQVVLRLPPYESAHEYNIGVTYFSPDGKRLVAPGKERNAAGEEVGRLLAWDAASGKALPSIVGPAEQALPISLSFSPAGGRLAVVWRMLAPRASGLTSTSAVWLHDPDTGKALTWVPGMGENAYPSWVRLSPDGGSLLTISSSGALRVMSTNPVSLLRRLPQPPDTTRAYAFDAGGKVLTVERNSVIRTWAVPSLRHLQLAQASETLNIHSFLSADGRRLALALVENARPKGGGAPAAEVLIVDPATGEKQFSVKTALASSPLFAMSASGKRLLVPQPDPNDKNSAQAVVWDIDTGKQVTAFGMPRPTSSDGLVLSRDGNRAAAYGGGNSFLKVRGQLSVWDVPTGRTLFHQELAGLVGHLEFTPDGDRVAFSLTGGGPNTNADFHVIDLQTGKSLWSKPWWGNFAFSPNGRRLAIYLNMSSLERREILVVDAATGEKQLRLEGDDNNAGSLLFNADGTRILTIGRELKLWDAETGEELLSLPRDYVRTTPDRPNFPAIGTYHFRADGKRLTFVRTPSIAGQERDCIIRSWDALPRPTDQANSARTPPAAPASAFAHYGQGLALRGQRKPTEAVAAFRRAIELDDRFMLAHRNLGYTLNDQRRWPEAIAAFRKVLQLSPRDPSAHSDLAWTLAANKELDAAVESYRNVIAIDPEHRGALTNLRDLSLRQGHYAEAHQSAQQLLKRTYKFQPEWADVVRRAELCERLAALAPRLSDLIAGQEAPANNRERLDVALLCQLQRRHVNAVRLYNDAFAAEPKAADDLQSWDRYNAACCAVLAASGQAIDTGPLDEAERGRLRGQALAWLRADLQLWTKQLAGDAAKDTRRVLEHWQRDSDFIDVRGEEAIKRLPAAEQAQWRALWTEVAELLKRTEGTP